MTPTHLIRFTQALVLAALVAALAAPAVALGGSNPGKPAPNWFERNDAAHPFGNGTVVSIQAPDWFERYAAAHPFGHGVLDTIQAPDAFERYAATHATTIVTDGRSPDTLDAATNAGLQVADGRSPDTLDAAQTAQPIELVSPGGFDWSDAGIGAGMGAGIIALLGSLMVALMTHRRHRVQTT